MGYTHYWESVATDIPDDALRMIRELVGEAYAAGIIQYEYNEAKAPVVTPTDIRFNGIGEDGGHQRFHFRVTPKEGGIVVAYCKTNHKPYDVVVMQVLVVLKYFLKECLTVLSDGSFADEWQGVRDAMAKRYGIETFVHEELVS